MKLGILVSDFLPKGRELNLKNGISLGVGGTELQSYNLAKRFAKRHQVMVFTRHYKTLPRKESREGFKVRRFRTIKIPALSFLTHIAFSLITIRKNRPDLLQCMMLTPNGLVGVFANKLFGIKSIPWVRGGDWYITRKSKIGRIITSLVIRKSPLILVQTEKTRKEILKEFPGKNIISIPNAVETKKDKADGDKVVYVGNLIERKGVEYLIEAMKGLDAELLIVGDGPKRSFLESIAGENVKFTGRARPDEVELYMRAASIFALPAKKGEGLPNVILEAMSLGIPVVSTNIAGISDVVEHSRTGFLVAPKKSKELRMYIKRLLDNKDLREEMSRNCLEDIKKYSWENMIRRLEIAYMKINILNKQV